MAAGLVLLDRPLGAVTALAAAIVAAVRLRRPLAGPPIADRELDLIVGGGALAVTAVLLIGQVAAPAHALGLLAAVPALCAALALAAGTRRLWQDRAVPAVAALGWLLPWSTSSTALPLGLVGLTAAAALLAVRR
jgi:hypothetical protein